MTRRILVTGSRTWTDQSGLRLALFREIIADDGRTVVVHGAARGADTMADRYARMTGCQPEPYPAEDFPSPRDRNQHMVDLGADVCLAFATSWASGTGMCARMARRAGIPVVDFGVDTRREARP
jgi:YspA, cpYpsA-related SLOG family